MGQNSSAKVAKGEIVRQGRDEMNLVEYPFACLWKQTEPSAKILHEWEKQHPVTGKTVRAYWRVTGDSGLGLPTPSDEQVYLVLMELTHEAGMQNQTVHFSRYNLLKRLSWIPNDVNYRLLRDAFTRLAAVAITSQNAFWDAKVRSFRTVGFSILDNFDILEEPAGRKKSGQGELPLSFFKWNDVLFQSFQAGHVRAIDLGCALSLKGSLALRLYRYLDKKSYDSRRAFEIELAPLCERHLGMRPSPYASKYKERLASAHEELMACGFLAGVSYEPMSTKKAEKVRYIFGPRRNGQANLPQGTLPLLQAASTPPDTNLSESAPGSAPTPALTRVETEVEAEADALLQHMLSIKVSPDVARELLRSTPPQVLRLQLGCLADRAPKNAAAVFVKAVREEWEVPAAYSERQQAEEHAQRAKANQAIARERAAQEEALKRAKSVSQEKETIDLDALWEKLDPEARMSIEDQATERLGVLGRTGRAQGALVAMRRILLRERMQQLAEAGE